MKQLLKSILPLFIALPLATSCGGDDDDVEVIVNKNINRNDVSTEPALQRLEFPRVKGGNSRVIIHTTNDQYCINYSVEWDCDKKSQRWSCYQMTATNRVANTKRYYPDAGKGETQYPNDPALPSQYYYDGDPFRGSGYDHGHICPSADRLYSVDANVQTFYLTNMQPQLHVFNAGIWEKMEEKLRSWLSTGSKSEDTLYVCKGGTIDAVPGGIEKPLLETLQNGLPVPRYFFMALLRKSKTGYKALAFWVEHSSDDRSNDALGNYVISVRELERLTGIDFFCNLPDDIENEVETTTVENIKWLWGL
jgi:endonuclease G